MRMQCLLLECLWESIGLRRSFHNLGGQKKSQEIDAFCNFFFASWAWAGLRLGRPLQKWRFCLGETLVFSKPVVLPAREAMFSNVLRPMGPPPEPEALLADCSPGAKSIKKTLSFLVFWSCMRKKHWKYLFFSIAGVPMGVHWAPSQLPQFGRPKKKSRNRCVLQLFFRQLGLGWAQAGSATSKVKVLSRRNVSFFKTCCFACTGGYVFKCFATNGAATWTRSSKHMNAQIY